MIRFEINAYARQQLIWQFQLWTISTTKFLRVIEYMTILDESVAMEDEQENELVEQDENLATFLVKSGEFCASAAYRVLFKSRICIIYTFPLSDTASNLA